MTGVTLSSTHSRTVSRTARSSDLIRAEQPQLRHLRDQVLRELSLEVVLADDRGDVVVHPLAHRVADGALFRSDSRRTAPAPPSAGPGASGTFPRGSARR